MDGMLSGPADVATTIAVTDGFGRFEPTLERGLHPQRWCTSSGAYESEVTGARIEMGDASVCAWVEDPAAGALISPLSTWQLEVARCLLVDGQVSDEEEANAEARRRLNLAFGAGLPGFDIQRTRPEWPTWTDYASLTLGADLWLGFVLSGIEQDAHERGTDGARWLERVSSSIEAPACVPSLIDAERFARGVARFADSDRNTTEHRAHELLDLTGILERSLAALTQSGVER
jgi:hypothetical protein